ncbi:MAG TPA: pirin family protein [Terriglobia bacterium]|nr:pirin family protein [Terriglobia bacterium]
MIRIIKSKDRHHANFGWLDTHWHFSFDSYYDPENLNWGPLRVFNDDTVQPAQGFGTHPHRDMEIVTYVLSGALEHQDSTGNRGVLEPGEVQVMSAGTGLMHSEYNHSKESPVHFIQLWILPRTKSLKPRWEQRRFAREVRAGRLLPVVSSGELKDSLTIDQDAQIYVSSLGAGQEVAHLSQAGRKAYLFVAEGSATVNGQSLAAGDQARIADEPDLRIQSSSGAELMLLDLPSKP